jgi:hypothetical protein
MLGAILGGLCGCSGLSSLVPAVGLADYFPLSAGIVWTYDVETTRDASSANPRTSRATVKHRVTSADTKGGILTATLRAERGSSAPTIALERTPEGDIYSMFTIDSSTPSLADRESVSLAPVTHQGIVVDRFLANKLKRDLRDSLKEALRSALIGPQAGSKSSEGGEPLPTETLRLFEAKVPSPGVSWDFQEGENSVHYKATSMQESVTTPAGTWDNALKVTQTATAKVTSDESVSYYAPGVGLVKRSVKSTSRSFGIVSDVRTEVTLTNFVKQ